MVRSPQTRISVALCTFNGAPYVRAQVASILTQTLPVHEIVIADDGSVDGTPTMTRELANQRVGDHPHPQCVMLDGVAARLGVSANFERALRATTGDVIFLADQDDVWSPSKVAVMASAMETTGAWVAHSDARLVDAEGETLELTALQALRVTRRERAGLASGAPFTTLLRRNLVTGATMAVRRELLDVALPIPQGWLHDEWLAIIGSALAPTAYLEDALIDYRQHGANVIGVSRAGWRARVSKMFEPRHDRTAMLEARARRLVERLVELDARPEFISAARAKQEFEGARARLPRSRVSRVPGILRLAGRGDYPRFASQGWMDIARDLLQSDSSLHASR